MSRKRNQGSRNSSPSLEEKPNTISENRERRSRRTTVTVELQALAKNVESVAACRRSTAGLDLSSPDSDDEGKPEDVEATPEVGPSKNAAKSKPEMKDAKVGTALEPKRRLSAPHRSSLPAGAPDLKRVILSKQKPKIKFTTSSENYNENEPHSSKSAKSTPREKPLMPLILVAAKQTPEMKDAHVGTDPTPKHRAADRQTSSLPAGAPDPHHVIFAGQQEQLIPPPKISTSSDNYDQDEPLTTKVTKVYKKRHRKPNLAADDSDESFLAQFSNEYGPRSSIITTFSADTDVPQSDETDMINASVSSSIQYSSSGSLYLDDNDDLSRHEHQGNLPPGFKLASGLAFIYMAIPPDGGYGWLVLSLSFLAQLIVDGIIFSIGILLPFMSAEFDVSTALVVLVGSIQIGCYFLGGAFSSALINSYGFRPVALLGVTISALAILAASFSPNLWAMIMSYSIIGGAGLSMIWVSSQLIIGYYFERYRPIASGFSCSGAGAGIFIFNIVNNNLVQSIGWRNTMRVQVILIIMLFFVAVAYLEVAPTPVGVVHHTVQVTSSSSNEYYGNFYVHNFLGEDTASTKSRARLESYEPPKRQGRLRRWASRCSPCFRKREAKSDHPYHTQDDDRSERNYVVRPDPMQRDDLFYTGPADYDEPHSKEQFDGKELELVGTEHHLQRAAYGLKKIHDYDSTGVESEVPLQPEETPHPLSPTTAPQAHKRKKQRKHRKRSWLKTKVARALNRLFDVHLLKSFEFRILLTSAFFYPMGFNIPFVYSKVRCTIPPQYAQMIGPAIGATNFIARILCGFVAYKLRSWTNYICGGGMVLGGIMVFTSAFYGSDLVWFQLLYGLCYGVAPAVFATLRALIYVRYLGLSKLTNAFGITALAMGLGVFIGTTMGGFLVSKTGDYTSAFAFAGICIIFSGCLKLILPTLIKSRQNPKRV